jgi:hypothetical protein
VLRQGPISTITSERWAGGFRIIVKSIYSLELIQSAQNEKEVEHFVGLRRPCIAGPIGFVHPSESQSLRFEIMRLYC